MATYSTSKKLLKIYKKPLGRYAAAGFVGRKTKRLKVVMFWRERRLQILLIGIN